MRVLIAEDEPLIAIALAERLRSLGHEPIGPAADGEQALAGVAKQRHHLVLMGIQLPIMDGYTATSRIRPILLYDPSPSSR